MALAVVRFPGTLNTADPGFTLTPPSSQLTQHLLTPLLSPCSLRVPVYMSQVRELRLREAE